MQVRSKIVELAGHKFQVRKLPPESGSFIFMRMMGLNMRNTAEAPQREQPQKVPVKEVKLPDNIGELRVRALTFAVFSGAISFEDFKFIQMHCMRSVSILKIREGMEFPLPIMNDHGTWTSDGDVVVDDVKLVMNLTAEVLVLCFASFFEASVPGA